MTKAKLFEAMTEARRFLKKGEAAMEVLKTGELWSSKETGACRRASMDLTRSLAELRRGRT
jgi:hypothetical protein